MAAVVKLPSTDPPAVYRAQRVAVDRARELAGLGATVHVYGAPESMRADERRCGDCHNTTIDAHRVIYHVHTVALSNGGWVCMTCGNSSEEPDGTA